MTHSLSDLDRRKLRLDVSGVSELLPEYFQSEYGVDSGSLIKLLELYYDYLDSDGNHAFQTEIRNIFSARDISQTDETYLDELIKEIGNGLQSSSFFQNPRLMARLIPLFYKSKGTLVGTEGFFRGFYGEEVEIEYPKDKLLHVGGIDPSGVQGRIGFEYQNRILDNEIYQIFSILIKAGISVSDYQTLYKKFSHPAGFHFAGQVLSTGNGIITLEATGINPLESSSGDILLLDQATQIITTPFVQLTAIYDSADSGDPQVSGVYRVDLNDLLSKYQDLTLTDLEKFYSSVETLSTPNSFTFDNNRRRRAFDVGSDDISFSNTNGQIGGIGAAGTNPTLRLVGTIAEWNAGDDSAFFDYWNPDDRVGAIPATGTMAVSSTDGFIDSNTTVMVTGSNNYVAGNDSGENYERHYTTKYTVDLSNIDNLFYWTLKGAGGWGNDPNSDTESLYLHFGKTLHTDGTILNPSVLKQVVTTTETSNVWSKHTVSIAGVADSNVYLEFFQDGDQFGDVKDNWAFTSVFMGNGNKETYDSVGPDMSLILETMDNDMFTRYLSDSAI